jgi:hypothetical protein
MSGEVQHLSHSFRTDAAHLIIKARCASKAKEAPQRRTSYIAKLVVDAYMACECALKSMITSSIQGKSGVQVYREIWKCGHDLRRLMKQAGPKSITEDDRRFLKQASKRGVSLRYNLDLFSLTTCELLPDDQVTFQVDQKYFGRFLRIAVLLTQEADIRHLDAFRSVSKLMPAKDLKSYVKRLRGVSRRQEMK